MYKQNKKQQKYRVSPRFQKVRIAFFHATNNTVERKIKKQQGKKLKMKWKKNNTNNNQSTI